jgi:hypothetical protein
VKRLVNVFLSLIKPRLDHFERLVLQIRLAPHQPAKITRRHSKIRRRVGDIARIVRQNLDHHVKIETGHSGGNGENAHLFVLQLVQHLSMLVDRILFRNNEAAPKPRLHVGAAFKHPTRPRMEARGCGAVKFGEDPWGVIGGALLSTDQFHAGAKARGQRSAFFGSPSQPEQEAMTKAVKG